MARRVRWSRAGRPVHPPPPATGAVFVPVLVACLLSGLVAPTEARAHSGAIDDSRFYVTELTSVSPAVPGLAVTVARSGDWVEVTNSGSLPVTVLGYTGEPYLRVGPGGAERNTQALAAYLNDNLAITRLPPDWTARPERWERLSRTPTVTWHDHRVQWMTGAHRPQVVEADPEHPHLISTWTLRMRAGAVPVTATGTLSWVGRPGQLGSPVSRWIWGIGLVALLFVGWRLFVAQRGSRAAPHDHPS